jgi:predicted Zn-dependent protease
VARRWSNPRRLLAGLALLCLAGWATYHTGRQLWALHHFRQAQEALRQRHFPSATVHLTHCLAVWPDRADVHLAAAQAARRHGDFDEAQRHLNWAQALDAPAEAVTLEWNLLRAQQGDLPEAVEGYLISCLRAGSADGVLVQEALAQAYLKTRQLFKARGCVEELLRQCPDHAAAHVWHGEILERLHYPKLALEAYRRAIELAPEDVYGRLSLAELLLYQLQPKEAVGHFEFLHERLPDNRAVALGLARCQRRLGRFEDACRLLDGILADHPQEGLVLAERGLAAWELGNVTEAETYLRRATARRPYDRQTNYVLYQCLEQLGRKAEAETYRARADAIDADLKRVDELLAEVLKAPQAVAPRYELAVTCLRVGQEEEALTWLAGILRDAPDHGPTHRILAEYYERAGQPERAAYHRRRAGAPGKAPG